MKAPKAPDPVTTANAQGQMNKDTAITQYLLNATDQVTPTGSLTYKQTGSTFTPSATGENWWQGPNGEYQHNAPAGGAGTTGAPTTSRVPVTDTRGNTHWETRTVPGTTTPGTMPAGWKQVKGSYTPHFTATQTDSANQALLRAAGEKLGINLTNIGIDQSDRLKGLLSKPFDGSNDATESRLMELGRKRLDPILQKRSASQEQDLFNRGVRPGSEAYANARTSDTQGQNDAYNQLLLTGHNQAYQEGLTNRNQPINEILALANGAGGVAQPGYVNTPGSQVAPVDYTGLVNQQYQSKLQNYQSGMSGMFGLGSALIGALPFSDRRLKYDIEPVGRLNNGQTVYLYTIDGMRQIGVMADECKPEAIVIDPATGYSRVDYDRAVR